MAWGHSVATVVIDATDQQGIGFAACEGLEELIQAYPSMLHRLRDIMLSELQVPNFSPQSLAELRARADNIKDLAGDCDVGGDERHFDLGRATRARPVRAARAVQALHQVAEALATRGPGAVDGDELCVVGERRGDGASFNQAVDSR